MTPPDVDVAPSELTGLFEGVRILEIGQFVAAPIAAQLFAHGGADVIKLEPITGDQTRSIDPLIHPDGGFAEGRQYVVKAFGKRGIPVDLSQDGGRSVAHNLAATCDVVISNLRPGTAPRLGLDFESLRTHNPRLVYGEINGYGDTGPLAEQPSLDLIAQSWSGLRLSGTANPDGSLAHYEAYFCDYTAGLLLAFGVAAALRHREITGEGQRVSTSLAHAGLFVQHRVASLFESTDGWKRDMVARRASGEPLDDLLPERFARTSPAVFYFGSYETSDGLISIGATGAMGPTLCGLFDLVDPRTTPAWAERADRPALMAQARSDVAQAIAPLDAKTVLAQLKGAGIPCAPVRLIEDVFVDPDAFAAGLVFEGHHPRLGDYVMPGTPINTSGAEYKVRGEVAAFGEHTDELLAELGYDQATIEKLVADGIVARSER